MKTGKRPAGLDEGSQFSQVRPTNLAIIQGTPFCNLDCSYCYLPNRSDRRRMDLHTVGLIGRFLASVPQVHPQLPVVWHAGEPLILRQSFYEDAFSVLLGELSAKSIRPVHNIQTNAVLIDDAWCRFFVDHGVRVGVSIDGPRHLHDLFRLDRKGRGTFDRVMRGVSHLQEAAVPFTVIAVLGREALCHPDQVFSFFVEHGILNLAFNIQEIEGANTASNLTDPDVAEHYAGFFAAAQVWREQVPGLHIRDLHETEMRIMSTTGIGTHSSENQLGSILNFAPDGGVSTFSPELFTSEPRAYGSFVWGNVHADDFSQFIERVRASEVWRDIASGIESCAQSCAYFSVCGGGAPSNKLAELGDLKGTETASCRLQVKVLSDLVLTDLERKIGLGDRR